MRTSSMLLSGAVAAVVVAGSANADYVLQSFSGSSSATAGADRTTPDGATSSISLNYNAIAGGASSMEVQLVATASGETLSGGKTTAANHGTYGPGFTEGTGSGTKYYKYYYGGNSGTSSSFTANDNFRAWSAGSTSTANVSGSGLSLSSSMQWDSGISDYTKVRYTNNSYNVVNSAATTTRSDAFTMYTESDQNLIYRAATGQAMNLSASTGLTAIRLEGSGFGAADGGRVSFYMTDAAGVSVYVIQEVSANQALGNLSVGVTDFLAASPALDLTQITEFSVSLWSSSTFNDQGRDMLGSNNGFSYNATQMTLVGYSVPAPGAAALVGAAGLITVRRRR